MVTVLGLDKLLDLGTTSIFGAIVADDMVSGKHRSSLEEQTKRGSGESSGTLQSAARTVSG